MGERGANRMWGGRFSGRPAEAFTKFGHSLNEDKRLWREDIAGSIAHARMLGQAGILAEGEAEAIIAGLEQIAQEIEAGVFDWSQALEDVHMNIEARLIVLIGPAGGKLHTGRSRNDQVATDIRLWTRNALARCEAGLTALMGAFLAQAEAHHDTLVPGFTHLQIAQPIVFAHYCLAYVEMFARDRARLADARGRLNESPLGAAALAGTSYPIDREATAQALGFDRPMANSLDAVSARDFALEAVAAASICAGHISRFAEEVVVFSAPPFGYVQSSEGFSTGSSIMPQKRNPDAAELLRAKIGSIAGAFTALTLQTKALPIGYSKDLQETKAALMDALDTLEASLVIAAGLVAELQVNAARLAEDAGAGHSTATDLADALAREGVPFREAHDIVGRLVALADHEGCALCDLDPAKAAGIDPRITADHLAQLTPEASVAARTSYGGAGRTREAAAAWRERLQRDAAKAEAALEILSPP